MKMLNVSKIYTPLNIQNTKTKKSSKQSVYEQKKQAKCSVYWLPVKSNN